MSTTMSGTDRQALLSSWIKPSSDHEQERQDRAQRRITDAVKAHAPLQTAQLSVYTKGSYPNNTNVRLDSDVDIVVECQDCCYYDFAPGVTPSSGGGDSYAGIWTPAKLRSEVLAALQACFGTSDVDAGSVAIRVAEKKGSRPNSDVVPSFRYRRYLFSDRSRSDIGTKVFRTDGTSLVNWPQQQLDNGRAKNPRTGGRYKNYARALKNAENALVQAGDIEEKPSYLMECLAWNVPDDTLKYGDLASGFSETLVWLWEHLTKKYEREEWLEPNEIKFLFHSSQGWSVDDAKEVVLGTWRLLDY